MSVLLMFAFFRGLRCYSCVPASQEWWDAKVAMRMLRPCDVNPSPYKDAPHPPSPLRSLCYVGDNPKRIFIDPAHTYAIDGIGKSYCASCVVLLAIMEIWGKGKMESRLDYAYQRLLAYCTAYQTSTTIDEFSYKTLKLPQNSFLARIYSDFK